MKIVAATVMKMAVYGLMMLVSFALYAYLTAGLLPRLTLKLSYAGHMGDRGIRRARSEAGRAVTYRPAPVFTPYIPQYLLYASRDTGLKYLKCQKNPGVRRLSYDVAVFDNRSRLLDVLRVDEETDGTDAAAAVRLPGETSYVSLIVRRADGYRCRDAVFALSAVGMGVYAAVTALLTAGEALLLRGLCLSLLETGSLAVGEPALSAVGTLLVGAAAGLMTAALVLCVRLIKLRRVVNA